MACAPTRTMASRCALNDSIASSSTSRARIRRSSAPGILVLLHPLDQGLRFGRTTSRAREQVGCGLAPSGVHQSVLVNRAFKDDAIKRLGDQNVWRAGGAKRELLD